MDDEPSTAEPTFEESFAALESAVHELEDGRLGLADALARYEESVKHLKRCYQLLEQAEQKIELLTGLTEEGTACTEPFVESEESAAASVGRRKKSRSARASTGKIGESHDIDGSAEST